MAKKWEPKCITENREYAATSDGYLIPCCWCDKVFNEEWTNNDPLLNALFDEELKVKVEFDFGARSPVAAVVNRILHVWSDASFATVIWVGTGKLVKFAPLTAGSVAGNLPFGIVPESSSDKALFSVL